LRCLAGSGAGNGNRTRVFSLEGCCTTIVLYPPGAPRRVPELAAPRVRRKRPRAGLGGQDRGARARCFTRCLPLRTTDDRHEPRRRAFWSSQARSPSALRRQSRHGARGSGRCPRLDRHRPPLRHGRALRRARRRGGVWIADGDLVVAGRQGPSQPQHRDRLVCPQTMARYARHEPHQARRFMGDLGGDRGDLRHRTLLLAGQFRICDVVLHLCRTDPVRRLHPLRPLDRPVSGRAARRCLAPRRLDDRASRRRPRGDLRPSARLGRKDVLPRLHARDRSAGVRRFRPRRCRDRAARSGRGW
jgi:hypothetical protein